MKIRKTLEKDRKELVRIIKATGAFTGPEEECAEELLDIYLNDSKQKDYYFLSALEESDNAIGYICYGEAPFTDSVYYIYWIAVDPGHQGKGIGKALVNDLERILNADKARMLLIETSSKASYSKTRSFYENNNYKEFSRIKDFYKHNDDRITYGKALNEKPQTIAAG